MCVSRSFCLFGKELTFDKELPVGSMSLQQLLPQLMFSKVLRSCFRASLPSTSFRNRFFFSEKRPATPQERARLQKLEYQQKRSTYLNIALTCFVFAACFAGIPLYRTFCEHMGLVGDTDKKEYTFTGRKINNLKKFKVSFTGACDPDIDWVFEPVERELVVSAGETAIVFYRLYNREDKAIVGFATYNISPEDCNVYFSKIQCFCFNQQLINPKEELLLPIFFYLQPEINEDEMVGRIQEIKLSYSFTKSAKQDLARFAAAEQARIEENKRKLNEIRAKKLNMTMKEYLDHIAEEQQREEEENARMKEESQRLQREMEQARIKKEKSFEEDLIKAEIISRQFEQENYASPPTAKYSRAAAAV